MRYPSPRSRFSGAFCAVAILLALAPVACAKKSDPGAEATVLAPGGNARVMVGEHGFAPTSIALSKGAPGSTATLTFLRTTDETCAKQVVFPELGLQKDLPLDKPVAVSVPADTARTLVFQCGMAMYKGSVVVR